MRAALSLSQSGPVFAFQLATAAALVVAGPAAIALLDGVDRVFLAAPLVAGVGLEAVVASRYFGAQRDAIARPTRRAGPRRVLGALVVAILARGLAAFGGALPGLSLAILARLTGSAELRVAATWIGALGALTALVFMSVLTALVSRIALFDGLGPLAAFGRSLAFARRRWPELVALQLLSAVAIGALVCAPHLLPLLLVAALVRWGRDLALSCMHAQGPLDRGCWGVPSTPHWNRSTPRRLAPAMLAAIVAASSVGRSDVVSAQVSILSSGSGVGGSQPTGTNGRLVTPNQGVVTEPTAPTPEVQERIAFEEANGRLANAEEGRDVIRDQIQAVRGDTTLTPADRAARLRALRSQLYEQNALIGTRREAVNDTGNAILSRAYGGQYGTLARNWIDIKNTPSFLLGIAESTPSGAVGVVRDVGGLIGRAYDRITGNAAPAEPAPSPDQVRQTRLADREQELATELARISDGASVNRSDGNWYGEHVVGPVVTGEAAALVVRGGLAVRSAVVAKRTEEAAQAALVQANRAAMVERLQATATQGLPRVEGQLVDTASLGQGGQYLPFRMADGTQALVYRGQDALELRDARVAIDAMNEAQPGVMPKIYGQVRLPNGEPGLVLERFDGAQVAMHSPREPFVEPLRRVLQPGAAEEFNTFGGFGRALDRDYVFLEPGGNVRIALPRRASQFRELVESGRIFQNTTPPTLVAPYRAP